MNRYNSLDTEPTMLIFSALGFPPFYNFKLSPKSPTCAACGKEGERIGNIQDIDYVQWCGRVPDWVQSGLVDGDAGHRISVQVLDLCLLGGLVLRSFFRNSNAYWTNIVKMNSTSSMFDPPSSSGSVNFQSLSVSFNFIALYHFRITNSDERCTLIRPSIQPQ